MRFFKAVLDWYIRGSLHVSLALISLVIFTSRVMEVPVSDHYYLALFFGSITAYNAIKYGLEPGKHSLRVPGGLRALAVFSLISLVLALYHLSYLPIHIWILLLVCAAISAVYAIPVIPGNRNLRSIGLLKVFLVSLVWTLATLWIPIWGKVPEGTWDLYVESFQRILWVVLLMLPFEIRDMHLDPPFLRTIPQRWGIPGTRRAAWIGVVVFAGVTWLKDSPVEGELLSKALTGLLMGLSTAFASDLQTRYYASFWVEGIPLLSLVLLVLFGG
jgi:hypothetical protein